MLSYPLQRVDVGGQPKIANTDRALTCAIRGGKPMVTMEKRRITSAREAAALVLVSLGLAGYALAGGAIFYLTLVMLSHALQAGVP